MLLQKFTILVNLDAMQQVDRAAAEVGYLMEGPLFFFAYCAT